MYNITTNSWLRKDYFVHALLPDTCTDDLALDAGSGQLVPVNPAAPFSVAGEPTRGFALDGRFGRASAPVLVPQFRRRGVGWDGCRDRVDARDDLPRAMQWLQPSQRAFHGAVWSDRFDMMLLYGGERLLQEQTETLAVAYPTAADGQLWTWGRFACPRNCSGVGDCWYGHCYCYDGYYGIDCSNSSCPGTFCDYNNSIHVQRCQHCCSAPYNHSDGDPPFVENQRKVPCGRDSYGLSHGICDGFGTCQCAPPFLTQDCSVKNCPDDCSGRGQCVVEYPISRCVCYPPATGNNCNLTLCPNNCSWNENALVTRGECDLASGRCSCANVTSPYDRKLTAIWPYEGDDCSYVRPFAGARGARAGALALALAAAGLAAAALVAGMRG